MWRCEIDEELTFAIPFEDAEEGSLAAARVEECRGLNAPLHATPPGSGHVFSLPPIGVALPRAFLLKYDEQVAAVLPPL